MSFSTVPLTTIATRQPVFGPDYLADLKRQLFIDFKEHDALLKTKLQAAANVIEKKTGLLLYPGAVTVRWAELYDYDYLTVGPVTGPVTVTDLGGVPLTVAIGEGNFPVLTGNWPAGIVVSYQAGYDTDTLPDDLKQAALDCAANLFDGGKRDWLSTANLYRRQSWAL